MRTIGARAFETITPQDSRMEDFMRRITTTIAIALLGLGLRATEPTEAKIDLVLTQQYREIDEAVRDLKRWSPSFAAKLPTAEKANYSIMPGKLKGEFATTTLWADGGILVVVDFDRCREGGEPVVRAIAHEIQHVADMAAHKNHFVMRSKVDRMRGVSYRQREVEAAAYKFQAVCYAEYLAGKQAH